MNASKAFKTLLLYRIGATLSYQITMVAVGWHLYEITNSVVSLGLIGLAELVPYFALALYSGHAVDHHSRKLIAAIACIIHIAVALILATIALGWLTPPEPLIYSAVGLIGIGRALLRPSYQALFGQVIPREHLPPGGQGHRAPGHPGQRRGDPPRTPPGGHLRHHRRVA